MDRDMLTPEKKSVRKSLTHSFEGPREYVVERQRYSSPTKKGKKRRWIDRYVVEREETNFSPTIYSYHDKKRISPSHPMDSLLETIHLYYSQYISLLYSRKRGLILSLKTRCHLSSSRGSNSHPTTASVSRPLAARPPLSINLDPNHSSQRSPFLSLCSSIIPRLIILSIQRMRTWRLFR